MVAAVFHFPPSEIWNMTSDELDFWAAEAQKLCENPSKGK